MSHPSEIASGEILAGTYEVLHLIGRGAMGAVYCVKHVRTGGQLALKMLNRDLAADPEMYRRFEDEARIISALNHPNIVKLADWNLDAQGRPFLVMEYLDGEDLQLRLNRLGRLSVSEALQIAMQIGGALQSAHDNDIVHRDVKPQNIFLIANRTGVGSLNLCKLLDFGVSKVRRSQSQMTQNMTFIGTPEYMSPEAARGSNDELDGRSDQFSLAVILYHLLSGKSPFAGGDPVSVLYRVVHEPAPSLARLCAEAPPQVVRTIEQALSKEKDRRFGSIRDFVQALAGTTPNPIGKAEQHEPRPPLSSTTTLIIRQGSLAAASEVPSKSTVSGAALEERLPRRSSIGLALAMGAAAGTLALAGISLWMRHPSPGRRTAAVIPALPRPKAESPLPARTQSNFKPATQDSPRPVEPVQQEPPRVTAVPPMAPAGAARIGPGVRPAPLKADFPPFPLHKTEKAGVQEVMAVLNKKGIASTGARYRYSEAFASYRSGDYGRATEELESLYKETHAPSLLISAGHAALQSLKSSSAIRYYEQYSKSIPNPPTEIRSQLAQAKAMALSVSEAFKLSQDRQFCKAADKFDVECDPDTLPRINIFLGQALKWCGKPGEARAAYKRFLRSEPGAPESLRQSVSRSLKELEQAGQD